MPLLLPQSIMSYWAEGGEGLASAGGPGHWNDPDMLVIGDFGLSHEQVSRQIGREPPHGK